MSDLYVSLEDVREYVDIGQADDNMLLRMIRAAQTHVEKKTGRAFLVPADSSQTLPIFQVLGDTLHLDEYGELAAITEIVNGDGTIIPAGSYVTNPPNRTPYYAIKLKSSSNLSWIAGNDPDEAITITGRWGYSITPPEDLRQGIIRLVAWMYRQKDNSGDMDRPVVSKDGQLLLPSRLPKDFVELVDGYVSPL